MARIRSIKPEFWEDERVGALSIGARLLYLGLISLADDEGRFRASPTLVKAQIFPYDEQADVPTWMRELENAKRIIRYIFDGETFAAIGKFKKHQKIDKPSPSKLPSPQDQASIALASSGTREDSPTPRLGFATVRELSTTDQEQGSGVDQGLDQGSISPPAPSASAPEDQLVELWNSTAAPEMPRCKRLTDGRRKKARDLLKVIPLDEWPQLISAGNASDFCRGIGDADFKLSLSWMLKNPENALKVLEGNYANGSRKVDVRRGHVRAEDMNFKNVPLGEIKLL